MVESEVRRSSRVKEKSNGFKLSGCKLTNCLGCKIQPPTLYVDALQVIGTKLCQMSDEGVAKATLNKKNKPKPIAKKGKGNGSSGEADD